MSDSESGSDLSDIEASPSRPFKTFGRRSRLSNASNNGDGNESDSDSDDSVLGGLNRLQKKRKSRKEKDKAGNASDSDSDVDIVDDDKKRPAAPPKPAASTKPILNLGDDSDDSDDERLRRLRRRTSDIPESETLLKARRAREALAANDTIDIDSDDEEDEVLVSPTVAQKVPSEPVRYVKIDTRIKNGDPSKTHAYQLKINDPFEKLMEVYRGKHGYSKFRKIHLEYNGDVIDLQNSPKDLGFQESQSYLIDIQDEEQRLNQVRFMEQNQEAISSGAGSERIIGEAGGIPLKIRRNGCKNSVDTFRILPTSRFQTLMNFFYQKYGVAESDCKFEFDGCPLESQATPAGEDCEGDEVIDVKVDEAALAKGKNNIVAQVQSSRPIPIATSTARTASSVQSEPQAPTNGNRSSSGQSSAINEDAGVSTTSKTISSGPLTIFVVRNNKAPKPKKFKLLPTDKVIKLKEGYITHYRNKGCRSVKFYLRGSPIEDEGKITFETLNILPTERVIAMENGRKF